MNKMIAAALAATLLIPTVALAQQKHDSNTLHKLGKAIQYPVNKAAQNASITAHRATGKNSVAKRTTRSGRKVKRVIKPNGTVGHVAPK